MYPSRSHNPMVDCLSRIRNASFRYFEEITVTYSRPVHDLLDQLCDGGYISSYHVYEETGSSQAAPRMIQVTLKYHNNRPAIQRESNKFQAQVNECIFRKSDFVN